MNRMDDDRFVALRWQLGARRLLRDHKIFSLYELDAQHPQTGAEHHFVLVDAPDWVNIIALTPEDQVVMVRQYRFGNEQVTLEIPGGMIEPGEPPLLAAQRELREETGYTAARWLELGVVEPNPAFQTNQCWTFLALDAACNAETAFDPGEVITTELHALETIDGLIEQGEIRHSLVIAAFFHLLRKANGWKRPTS